MVTVDGASGIQRELLSPAPSAVAASRSAARNSSPGGEHWAAPARGSVLCDLLLAGLPLVGPVPPLILVPLRARTKKNSVTGHLDIQLVALAKARLASEALGNRHPAIGPQRHHARILPIWSTPEPRTRPRSVASPASTKDHPRETWPARARHPPLHGTPPQSSRRSASKQTSTDSGTQAVS